MNIDELLLICAAEECSEIAQEISKCLRFGMDHKPECYPTTNIQRVRLETADLFAIFALLEGRGIEIIPNNPEDRAAFTARVIDKMQRTLKSLEWSQELGVLRDRTD